MPAPDEEFRNPRYVATGADPTMTQTVAQPVAPQPVAQPAVVDSDVQAPEVRQVSTSTRRFAPDSVIVGIVGLVMLTFGLVVIARAGFDGPMNEPVVKVLGFTHTATLGLIEAALGLCLLICAATTSRAGAVFFGL